METTIMLQALIGVLTVGPVLWFIKDLHKTVNNIRDNHLKHIAKDIGDIKIRVAVLEEKHTGDK